MSLRRLFDDPRVVRTARVGVALAGAATIMGFAGHLWWFFDLFSHFRPQYVAGGLVLALVLARARKAGWAVAAFAIAAINTIPIVPLYLAPAEAAQAVPGRSLRLMAFNIFGFNHDHERVLNYLRRELPDVLVLLEVTPEWVPVVRELAAQYPHQWINAGDDATGIAMMSRERPSAAATLNLAQRGVASYLLTFGDEGAALSVLGTHLSWPLGPRASATRNRQLEGIAQLARASTHPLVVMGDLNITPFSSHFTQTLRDGGLRRCVPGVGLMPTWPARVLPFYIQIDHCLASAGVLAWNFRTGEYLGSDHYPISVEVAVKEGMQNGEQRR
ncbi:MAG TPA: endonuclease/exonuclease/phosphatase family protein [Steroidobacteraceae bacterium]|nr:endonuclease/exonuclease/phosphatase family protein [Steroidobacteraceae bacterium]